MQDHFDLQDQKNSWQSAEELRKYKDNREKQNSVWKQRIDEPKCNIQKESKMMGVPPPGQPPIITHTAATPQDSPNTTLDVGYRDLNCRAVYPAAALSIESIDRSGVCRFIPISGGRHYALVKPASASSLLIENIENINDICVEQRANGGLIHLNLPNAFVSESSVSNFENFRLQFCY